MKNSKVKLLTVVLCCVLASLFFVSSVNAKGWVEAIAGVKGAWRTQSHPHGDSFFVATAFMAGNGRECTPGGDEPPRYGTFCAKKQYPENIPTFSTSRLIAQIP